jgi:hypothetical protein
LTARTAFVGLGGHAHDDRQVAGTHVRHRGAHRVEPEAGMLHVEHGKFGSGGLQDLADSRHHELEDERADLRRGGADLRAQAGLLP